MLIALHKGRGLIARAIQWQTRSAYSHASVILEEGTLIEAREFQGVRPLFPRQWQNSGESIELYRVRDLTPAQAQLITRFLWDQVNKPYDYTMVARFLSRRSAARASSGKWFCSELVFAAFARAGVRLLDRIEPWAVSPALLALSPLLVPHQETKDSHAR
jgi:uncharacterized protein YycO